MSEARAAILASIRSALGRGPLQGDALEQAHSRLTQPSEHLIPKRGLVAEDQLLDRFLKMATAADATTSCIEDRSQLVANLAQWCATKPSARRLMVSPEVAAWNLSWQDAGLTTLVEIPKEDGAIVLSHAFAGVAETGTLMMCCGPASAHSLQILGHTHVIVLSISRLLANYEQSWELLWRERGTGNLPRTLLWVTGPSRTGDIEQTLQLGAHGPKALHIIVDLEKQVT